MNVEGNFVVVVILVATRIGNHPNTRSILVYHDEVMACTKVDIYLQS